MDTPGGLVVPNVKSVEQKNIWQIAQDLNRLQEMGKAQKLTREDLSGGTFSLSNIGVVNNCVICWKYASFADWRYIRESGYLPTSSGDWCYWQVPTSAEI